MLGEEIDIFFTPVGVMPGSVLEVGDTFSFSGAMWPTLPSLTEITVTDPNGQVVHSLGRANKIGYFYNPDDDFLVSEPGTYTVKVKVTHDGITSAGLVHEPYPTGGILGVADGTYKFYVVPRNANSYLTLNLQETGTKLISGRALVISADIPTGLTNVTTHYTVNLTGTVLENGTSSSAVGSFTYSYDLVGLNKLFDNLDTVPGDTVVITLAVTGNDSSSKKTSYASQVLLQGDDVLALAES